MAAWSGGGPSRLRALRLAALLAALPAAPLAAQAPPFLESPAFGGASMFVEGVSHLGRETKGRGADSYFALGYSQGDFGADGFFSRLADLEGGGADRAEAAARGLKDGPWGARSRGFGLLVCEMGGSVAYTREATTSLWALGAADPDAPGMAGPAEGYEVRRAVGDRLALGYAARNDAVLFGSTLRVERWALGATRCGLQGFPAVGGSGRDFEDPLDYQETQGRSFSYALDAFLGLEPAGGLRLGVQANRLNARRLGDVEEKPQYRAGVQMDMGWAGQLTIEKDLNEAARLPFPVPQSSEAISLKIRANAAVTFSAGAERRTIGGAPATRYGVVVWLTGKSNRLGAGFQIGGERAHWGAAWRAY